MAQHDRHLRARGGTDGGAPLSTWTLSCFQTATKGPNQVNRCQLRNSTIYTNNEDDCYLVFFYSIEVDGTFTITRKRFVSELAQSDRPGYGLYNDRGKTPPYLPQMIVRNAAFQSRTGAQKQTRGAGPQLLLHLPSLGTPTPTPPFPVPSNMTQTQIQIQVQRQIHIEIQIQTANY